LPAHYILTNGGMGSIHSKIDVRSQFLVQALWWL
jgi:hypothetical protein